MFLNGRLTCGLRQNKVFIRTGGTDLVGFARIVQSRLSNRYFSTVRQFFHPRDQTLNKRIALFWIVIFCGTEQVYARYFFAFGYVPYATLSTVAKRIILRRLFETMFTYHLITSLYLSPSSVSYLNE